MTEFANRARSTKRTPTLHGLSTAIRVLNTVARDVCPLAPRDIAERTGINRTTVYRIVETYAEAGLLEWTDDHKVRPGIALLTLIQQAQRQHPIITAASPAVMELWQKTQESVSLSIRFHWDVVRILGFESLRPLRITLQSGERWPLHVTARGRVVLAYASTLQRRLYYQKPLQQYTSQTLIAPHALEDTSSRIRLEGYALSVGEMIEDAACIASPVFYRDKVIGSIDVAGPAARITDTVDPLMVRHYAQTISRQL